MKIRWNLILILAVTAVVLGATLAIAGSSSDRLVRKKRVKGPARLASDNFVSGLQKHRFLVTTTTLRQWLAGPTPPLVVDLRHAASYQVGHIAGALHRQAAALLSGRIQLKPKGRQVVIYDQDGRLAPYLIHPFRARGIDAYILAGGYAAWMAPSARRQTARRAAGATKKHGQPSPVPSTPPAATPPPVAAPPPMSAPPKGGTSGGAPDAPPADEGC